MSIEKLLERIALAIEESNNAIREKTLAEFKTDSPHVIAVDPAKPEAAPRIVPETLIHVGPENAGPIQQPVETPVVAPPTAPVVAPPTAPVVAPPTAQLLWDPTTAGVQKAYRTQDKKDAIAATLAELGIQAAKSWSYGKKHQAILDHVAQFGKSQQMVWADFEKQILINNSIVGRDVVLGALQQLEGHQILAQANVQPANYAKLLEMTTPAPTKPEAQAPVAQAAPAPVNDNPPILTAPAPAQPIVLNNHALPGAPAQYQPGTTVTTPDMLAAYARHLIVGGADPKVVQQSVAHIASGVTYVPQERVIEAFHAIKTATGDV